MKAKVGKYRITTIVSTIRPPKIRYQSWFKLNFLWQLGPLAIFWTCMT